jgi:signal transduction histidine kinase
MTHDARPGAIDSRLVFHVYAAATLPLGIVIYLWPLLPPLSHSTPAWIVRMRVTAAVITALGCCASAFAGVDDPQGRRRGLLGFAHAHLMLGVMLGIQAWAQWDPVVAPSPLVAWTATTVGVVLMYLAISGPGIVLPATFPALASEPANPGGFVFAIRNKRSSLLRLRSAYETEIRNAARQEERARLARDLHDAVKQQLFVIQTAGATAQARFDADPPGARAAVEQVRTAAREAMTEMEAMLDQLQSAPISNAGLVAFLRKQCEAIGFRTAAAVRFEAGAMPEDRVLDPGVRQTIARVAQEALSNVARHARAKNVEVSLGTVGGSLVLTVRDDGAGFSPGQGPRGMGLANLAARAAEVGASLDVSSAPGIGTTVRFAVPCGEPPSPRVYAIRAAVWIAVLLAARVTMTRFGGIAPQLGLMVMVIAAIAAVRYSLAAYDVGRRRA